MKLKDRLLVFIGFFAIAFIYFRVRVFFSFNNGEVPLIRQITGLTIHHFHYGLIFILIAALLLIFYKINWTSIGLMGFGLGTTLDSFVSRLFSFSSVRTREVATYNSSFLFTLMLFFDVILLAIVFYYWNERKL
jgi:hypothetical protein